MTRLVFCDTETTSLRHDRRAWEIAVIARDPDGVTDTERTWFVMQSDLDLGNADPQSLQIGRFWERHPDQMQHDDYWSGGPYGDSEHLICQRLEPILRGATIVAANAAFDVGTLEPMFRRTGFLARWHYRLLEIESYVAGALGWPIPLGLAETAHGLGIDADGYERHTALGDSRLVRDCYDACRKRSTS